MTEGNGTSHGVNERLDVLNGDVRVLTDDVRMLTDDVRMLTDDVRALKNDVGGLRVLYEHHGAQIQAIAEVQAHHGGQLDAHGQLLREIKAELAPLRDLRDFVKRIADEHEHRLTALEKHTGIQ